MFEEFTFTFMGNTKQTNEASEQFCILANLTEKKR